jgi:hypothetical protein
MANRVDTGSFSVNALVSVLIRRMQRCDVGVRLWSFVVIALAAARLRAEHLRLQSVKCCTAHRDWWRRGAQRQRVALVWRAIQFMRRVREIGLDKSP